MDDLIKTLKAQLYDRAISPLLGAFLMSWVAWNHRAIVVLLSKDEPIKKFAYLDKVLYPDWHAFGPAVMFPLLSAIFLIFIYPIPARFVYEHVSKEQKRLKLSSSELKTKHLLLKKKQESCGCRFAMLRLRMIAK